MPDNALLLFFHLMLLEMHINGKSVDSCFLSVHKIQETNERNTYIQGAINNLLEKWGDVIKEHNLKPEFYIKGNFPFAPATADSRQ